MGTVRKVENISEGFLMWWKITCPIVKISLINRPLNYQLMVFINLAAQTEAFVNSSKKFTQNIPV
jgi:hypothetical protein